MPSDFIRTRFLEDGSFWAVLLGNLFSIIMASWQGWDLGEILWVYWAQSVIIGAINVIRILRLKEFSTDNLTMNDAPVPETESGKRSVAGFFAVHYGFFHVIYFFFLWEEMPLAGFGQNEFFFLLLCSLGFLSAHAYSYRYNFGRDFRDKKPNLGTLMFYPYLRIIPMHLTIIFGLGMMDGNENALLLFMALKTLADIGMHAVEHHLFQKEGKVSSSAVS